MAPLIQTRTDQKFAILSEIKTYESIRDRITVPLTALQTLLASVKSYLEGEVDECNFSPIESVKPYLRDQGNGDDFGDIDDEDLMLAESAGPALTTSSMKRVTPSDFDEEPALKRLKATDDAPAVALAESILQKTWGFPHFRLKQQQAISRLITGGSAIVVFPTGGGKSLVYQIPALAFDCYDEQCGRSPGGGVTLVVSPLIALMKVSDKSFRRYEGTFPLLCGFRLTECVGSSRCFEEAGRLCCCHGFISEPRFVARD